jgi:hypothetical protein
MYLTIEKHEGYEIVLFVKNTKFTYPETFNTLSDAMDAAADVGAATGVIFVPDDVDVE